MISDHIVSGMRFNVSAVSYIFVSYWLPTIVASLVSISTASIHGKTVGSWEEICFGMKAPMVIILVVIDCCLCQYGIDQDLRCLD